MNLGQHYLENAHAEFSRLKRLADRAMEQIGDDSAFHFVLDDESNSIAVLIQHLSGNMISRWTDFLTTDGEKPDRHRDGEFEAHEERSRQELMEIWERGWARLFESLDALTPEDLQRSVLIRKEEHTVPEAISRQLTHGAYHVGQIVMLAKHLSSDSWKSLTIPKGKSETAPAKYKNR